MAYCRRWYAYPFIRPIQETLKPTSADDRSQTKESYGEDCSFNCLEPADHHRPTDRMKAFWMQKSALLAVFIAALLGPVSAPAQPRAEAVASSDGDGVLIVYLSRTGNTEAVAEIIHRQLGGDLVALELETPYPEDYDAIVAQVDAENETGYLPPLKTEIENPGDYDTVFLGFPTWDMALPPPMKSFLHGNDLGGKAVIPFNTNGGYGIGSSFRTVEELASDARILEGFSVKGGLERDGIHLAIEGDRRKEVAAKVIEWLRKIQMLSSRDAAGGS